MHGLDIIIRRNAEAAGREAGHAANDVGVTDALIDNKFYEVSERDLPAWWRGYVRGRQEG